MTQSQKDNQNKKYNFWAFARDVTLAAINRGQLPILGTIVILIIILLRLPEDKITEVAFQLISLFMNLYYIGWFLALLCVIGWVYTSRNLKRRHYDEIKNMRELTSKLQSSESPQKPAVMKSQKRDNQ